MHYIYIYIRMQYLYTLIYSSYIYPRGLYIYKQLDIIMQFSSACLRQLASNAGPHACMHAAAYMHYSIVACI